MVGIGALDLLIIKDFQGAQLLGFDFCTGYIGLKNQIQGFHDPQSQDSGVLLNSWVLLYVLVTFLSL